MEVILTTKSFMGRGGLKIVTSEMKILIGATIVMVTFGWKDLRLPHFSKILIYPDSYYSSISKMYHNGEVNPRYGIIVVSWAAFQAGMDDLQDGRNLGIHEVAHALHLENLIRNNQESDFFNPKVWANFQHLAQMEMQHKDGEALPWLGERASVDLHEFFAVALEHFFEKPHEFFRQAPELYGVLVRLLRQDPRVWIPKSEEH
ncbi:zinc-dependent peptidase [Algoriphagus halophytocola]|uniref:Zinc-dependent peptidase n=1 Tax=Algoriphagus halophytocola TaxID=2991499 RepID=A0ABY6MQ03_9BACT|nr:MULTISPECIES: zinc-dependent peptidase [unclassified Algoriphagus]UZD24534.1 zinc-dependent peptidase [Algoriphagus sp. TR-M5]WBL41898.1 zinc-dependent peptidase [Algoriphagus sp. TR-M9]